MLVLAVQGLNLDRHFAMQYWSRLRPVGDWMTAVLGRQGSHQSHNCLSTNLNYLQKIRIVDNWG